MTTKEIYYNAFLKNDGQINEIDLGEQLGLNENETRDFSILNYSSFYYE